MAELPTIRNLLPGRLSAGIIAYRGISPRPGSSLPAHIARQLELIRSAYATKPPPGFDFSRRLYRTFGIDPTRHRPSAEALWRRLRARGDFPAVYPLVDLTNLLSLAHQVCYGLYDLERVHGPVAVTLGEAGDRYPGIRKNVMDLCGRIVLRDDLGAFGNPSADSLRACVDKASRDILQVLFFHPEDPRQQAVLAATLAAFNEFFTMTESRSFII
jgi:DNA/RNA-binding domain of Phe-tRNA-synthetase-like protein